MISEKDHIWQKQFARNIRRKTPDSSAVYQKMVRDNIQDNLINVYPILSHLLGVKNWNNLVDNFIEKHSCQSLVFWQFPGELYDYLVTGELALKKEYPFILDLALYEWSIVDLYFRKDHPAISSAFDGTLKTTPVFSKEFEIFHFNYPVFDKNWKNITNKGNYFLMIYRNQTSFEVELQQLSPLLFTILSNLQNPDIQSIEELLDLITSETNFKINEQQKVDLLMFLKDLYSKKLIA
ncbi:MAG: putative DNA-binding domain-containing protein [Crocinitomicaceae bacterium]|nr:putative DNA-binding domain-containing protein [Crocinitomicaceae bacterium]